MGFKMANRAFEEVFGEGKTDNKEIYLDFMEMLKKHLKEEKGVSASRMREWIEEGNPLYAFTCRQDALEGLCDNMTKRKIPYVVVNETTGKTGILVREPDIQDVRKVAKKTLTGLARYCSVSDGNSTGMSYLKGKDEDKTMLVLGGLDREEAFYFAEHCGDILPGEMIGIDHMPDGTYLLTAHAKTAMKTRGSRSFAGMLARTTVLMNGEAGEEMRGNVAQRMKYLKEKSLGFPDKSGGTDSPVWIVGTGSCFVKRTDTGFVAGHAVNISDNVLLETDYTAKKEEKAYRRRLNSALARTTGHLCLYSIADVLEYYRRPRRTMAPAAIKGQELFMEKAAELVSRKVSTEKITRMEGKWEHKFRHYQKEMKRVVEGAALGRVPKGYSRADIISLRKVASAYGLDMKAMLPGMVKYIGYDSYAREAGRPRVTNLETLIDRHSGKQQESRETERTKDVTRSGER